jgi:ABC-type anion transport system duplicated permease subunit
VEAAAVFLIFTSQAWNMAFGVFEGITTIPADAKEAVSSYGCGRWRTFLRLLLPSAVPKLVYNSILSWAGGWYFLIACEIIALGPVRYRLPGLGSYLIRVTEEGNLVGAFAGLAVLTSIIVAMDLLLWRPLSVWAQKFRYEFTSESAEPDHGFPLVFSGGAVVVRGVRRMTRPFRRWVLLQRRRWSRRVRHWAAAFSRSRYLPRALGTARGILFWGGPRRRSRFRPISGFRCCVSPWPTPSPWPGPFRWPSGWGRAASWRES